MSSIAYVADEKMMEYHRLCGNRNANFWRLSGRNRFSDFHRGDLLFFYVRTNYKRKKGFIGYAHFDSMNRLSLHGMWKKYGTLNGYDQEADLQKAIENVARDRKVPSYMNCLYLKDMVFFNSPVFPQEVNLTISGNLESYTYLDQDNPRTTEQILRLAEKRGIDPWSSSQSFEPESIFLKDETYHQLNVISGEIGKTDYTSKEINQAKALCKMQLQKKGWQPLRGYAHESVLITEKQVTIAIPFVYLARNKKRRMLEMLGRIVYYQEKAKTYELRNNNLQFEILSLQSEEEMQILVKALIHE